MAGTIITGSPNITLLNSKIIADLCLGKFYIDTSPSVWITDSSTSPAYNGADNVQGAKIQIENPYGVIIKSYGSSFDITPPMTSIYEANIPTQAGTLQYGTYTISVQLTDEDGTLYVVSKTINVCSYDTNQNPCDDRLRLVASCKNGTLGVYLAQPPLFKGYYAQSTTQSIVVNYPTASGHAVTTSAFGNFSVQLFEGVYKVVVTVCALYNLTDNVYIKLPYSVTIEKNVKCLLDYTCIWPRIKQLWNNINSDCSEADKQKNASISLSAVLLIETIQLANNAGEDASGYIAELETLLGCVCTCTCSGSPIVNGTPSTDIAIEGCGFTKTTVGLTDVYTFDNGVYTLAVDTSLGILSITSVAVDDCTRTQTVSVNIANIYTAIKARVNNSTEYNFWAAVVNNPLNAIDATCLGYSSSQWTALTLVQKITAIIDKACTGGNCDAVVTGVTVTRSGADVILTWVASGNLYVQIWVDGDFVDAKASSITSITLPGFANGIEHTYEIKPFCTNNVQGVALGGTFNELGCPSIAAPSVSTSAALNVACPYNLTGLVLTLPSGITAEWHTANNTLSSTLVPDATSVTDGIYYVFAKDSNGCYSIGVQVVVTCQISGTCTAPQTLSATPQFGSLLIQFQSAAFPPTANSYTLKRRLYTSPDVDGSYTTLGSTGSGIAWNSSTNRWELSDASASDNTLYVYRAVSNCSGSPYVDLTYANIICPTISLTNTTDTISYSFVNSGGQIDKYVMQLYDETGVNLIETIDELPAFATPITGTFTGTLYSPSMLPAGTYKVRTVVYIGTYSSTCSFSTITIGDAVSGFVSNSTVASVTGVTFDLVAPNYVSGTDFPIGMASSGTFSTGQTGATIDVRVAITGTFTSVFLSDTAGAGHTILGAGSGTYTFSNVPIQSGGSGWFIQVN